VCDLETRETFISRDVVFQENIFPFAKGMVQAMDDTKPTLQPDAPLWFNDPLDFGPSETDMGLELLGIEVTSSPPLQARGVWIWA